MSAKKILASDAGVSEEECRALEPIEALAPLHVGRTSEPLRLRLKVLHHEPKTTDPPPP